MAQDFENLRDIAGLSDSELRDVVRETLRDSNAIDHEDIVVRVADGVVHLTGRVGTEQELRIAERLLTDVLGIERLESELVVDTLRRAESPIAIDEHLADEAEREALLLGERAIPISPETDHLADDVGARLNGTTDVHDAIERGTPWIPPESPTPEGLDEAGSDQLG